MSKKTKPFECWSIRLRNDENGFMSEVSRSYLAFNTLKFASFAAALAHARRDNLNPLDYVVARCRYVMPKVMEVRELDYSSSELFIAEPSDPSPSA